MAVRAAGLLVLMAVAAAGGCRSGPQQRTLASFESQRDRAVIDRMQQTVNLDFEQVGLRQVFEALLAHPRIRLNYTVDWVRLEQADVATTLPVTLRLSAVTIEDALRIVAEQVSSAAAEPIDWDVVRGVITISTREQLRRSTRITRTYNVRDLLVSLAEYKDIPGFKPAKPKTSTTTSSSRRSSSTLSLMAFTTKGGSRAARVDAIMDVIKATVGRDADWPADSLHELNGDLVVTATPRHHREIEDLLHDLRASRYEARRALQRQR